MLDKLIIKNFQKFSRLSLELSPTLTVLVGDSRAGKSTVLRFLRWMCQGGSSSGYTKHQEDTIKGVLFVDGHRIQRVKGRQENSYQLDDQEPYRAVRQEVPQEILTLLKLSDINFQGQLDPPFWLGLSPPEAARELNKIVNLDLIDSTLANLASSLRRVNTQEELLKKRLEQAEKKLQDLSWVPHAQKESEALDKLEEDVVSKRSRIASLAQLVEEGGRLTQTLEDASGCIREAQRLEDCLNELTIIKERARDFSELILLLEKEQGVYEERDGKLNALGWELSQLREQGCPLCGR